MQVSDQFSLEDFTKLRVREIEEIEDQLGDSIPNIMKGSMGRALHALVWVKTRRDNPAFTWEEAGEIEIDLVDNTPPTDASV